MGATERMALPAAHTRAWRALTVLQAANSLNTHPRSTQLPPFQATGHLHVSVAKPKLWDAGHGLTSEAWTGTTGNSSHPSKGQNLEPGTAVQVPSTQEWTYGNCANDTGISPGKYTETTLARHPDTSTQAVAGHHQHHQFRRQPGAHDDLILCLERNLTFNLCKVNENWK